ncbi:MAG: helix-hairpin-helix domain-containing protein [Calditrichaeota bacterium]|nr:MAG: helix-hairpin-helix domain-containing protein [Calditrichota bacterium]
MYFTSTQRKAILFILVVFGVAVAYHLADRMLHPPQPYDFSAFEAAFQARYDSLKAMPEAPSASAPAEPGTSGSPQSGHGIPSKSSSPATASAQTAPVSYPININTASAEELQQLPRVGPKTAARIIRYREEHGPFATKRDLMKVKGIGPKTLERLRPLITVE